MTYKEILIIFLLAHILSDFYFQTESLARKKEDNFKYVFIHSVIYGLITLIVAKLICQNIENIYLEIIIISHFLVDAIKYFLKKKEFIRKYQKYIFIIDQIIHIAILMILSYFMIKSGENYRYNLMLLNILNIVGISIQSIIILIVQILLVHKPTNILIVNIMQLYKPVSKEDDNIKNTKKAGRMIGTIERIIMLFFLLIEQYSSVGLVLTAKSIARYNKISEDKEFAEYYLLGTLLSTICVLMISII